MSYQKNLKPNKIGLENLSKMEESNFIRVKDVEGLPGVLACNFTSKAFYKKEWNKETTSARGLFLDKETGNILARGYQKFFNIGEPVNGPTKEEWLEKVSYPVRVTRKENGYLIILGSINGKLTVFSKGGVTPFSRHAEKFILSMWDDEMIGELIDFMDSNNVSITAEMVDPFHDPHMENYNVAELVLLDTISNEWEPAITPAGTIDELELLEVYGEQYWDHIDGVYRMGMVRRAEPQIAETPEELVKLMNFYTNETNGEGAVLQDSNGWMVKIKGEYYSNLKKARRAPGLTELLKGEDTGDSRLIEARLKLLKKDKDSLILNDIMGSKTWDIPKMGPFMEELLDGLPRSMKERMELEAKSN